ncbi:MAG: twin-arginine translocase TatA/TatE family subunit [Actinomycetota bacterium]
MTPFAAIGTQEGILIALVIVVIFGARKLPDIGRGLGQGIKEFKSAAKEAQADDDEAKTSETPKD